MAPHATVIFFAMSDPAMIQNQAVVERKPRALYAPYWLEGYFFRLAVNVYKYLTINDLMSPRGVAQLGSAPALGAGGPRFESGRPDCCKRLIANVLQECRRILFSPPGSLRARCVHSRQSFGVSFK